jgi:hypothetical protein
MEKKRLTPDNIPKQMLVAIAFPKFWNFVNSQAEKKIM